MGIIAALFKIAEKPKAHVLEKDLKRYVFETIQVFFHLYFLFLCGMIG